MSKNRDQLQLCAICGVREADTRDHVPPRGIFSKPRPDNLITVPACSNCNNKYSILEERFRVDLGLQTGKFGGAGGELYRSGVLRTVKHNQRLLRETLKRCEPAYFTTSGGIIFDRGYTIPWDRKAHDAVVEKMIRGLYYYHWGSILGQTASVELRWLKTMTTETVEAIRDITELYVFGKGEVSYRYGRASDSLADSIWVFQFYGCHWVYGVTFPSKTG